MTERVYVDAYGPDDDAVRIGFAWLVDEATRASESRVVISVPQLNNVQNLGGLVRDYLTLLDEHTYRGDRVRPPTSTSARRSRT